MGIEWVEAEPDTPLMDYEPTTVQPLSVINQGGPDENHRNPPG